MTDRDSDASSEARRSDEGPLLREQLAARKARLTPAQAKQYEERIRGADDARLPNESRRQPKGATRPLSFAQERLWFLEQLEPGTSVYNVALAFRLTGPLEEEALRSALGAIVARHEVLRTTYRASEGVPVQLIHPPRPVDWAKIDLSTFAQEQRDDAARDRITHEAHRPFDLTSDLMLRARLFFLATTDHMLLLVMHHIATDGWSTDILLDELSLLYNAAIRREEPSLPELATQYAEHALWQRERLAGKLLERDLTYWRRQLEGVAPRLSLPADRTRSTEPDYSGSSVTANLSASVVDRLKRLGHEENATLFMVLLTILMVLLRRYSGQDDICVGAPIAGRTRANQENLIGFFVNMLALRIDVAGRPSFRDLLKGVRHTCLEAYEHQELPFERLVTELQPARVRSRNPLFQVTLTLDRGDPRSPKLAGLTAAHVPIRTETTKFDLDVEARESTAGLLLTMTYSAALFDRSTMQQTLESFCRLCGAVVDHPEDQIDSVALPIDLETQDRITALNRTDRPYPRESCIQQEFADQVAESPEAVAVSFGNRQMTYRELDQRSDRLAHYLCREWAHPESLIGVYMERSPEMIVSLLAILKAGAAYVPLDPYQPRDRLRRMIEESRPKCVLSSSDVSSALPAETVPVLLVDKLQEQIAQERAAAPLPMGVAAERLAYVMFTSGSTGSPKGVEVTHRGVLRLVKGVDYVHLADRPRIAHLASPAFDASTFEIWGALLNGGQCVLSTDRIPSASDLGRMLRDVRIDTLWLTATWFNAIVDEDPMALSPVRQLIIGGEPLSVPHVDKALRVLRETSIINGYGPTEGTTFACCYRIPADFDPRRSSVPIGRPIANTKAYVLDSQTRPVPTGVPGELYIGGDGLARGYLGDPGLTAERFIPNPFADRPGERLYRTGDRVRLLPSGDIEYLGRLDRQLKIRGFRVEPGEIEHVLKQHPDVGDVRVALHKAQRGDEALAAYVIPAPGATIVVDSLKAYASKQLPEYMVPAFYISLPRFPVTPSGKADLHSLDALPDHVQAEESSPVPPRTEIEKRIQRIWSQLLRSEAVGIRDSFFDLGGHSLLALRLIARIEKTFGVSLPVSTLFEHPTIEALSQAVQERDPRLSRSTVVCLQKGDGGTPFFCAPPAASSVNHFAQLVRSLSPDIPFYGMQALGLERGEVPQDRVEDMAARYIADMRIIQPNGPYFIGGRCLGAYVAFEMALQLVDVGEDVALLALLDPTAPPGIQRDFRYYVRRVSYFRLRKQLVRAVLRRVGWSLRQAERLWVERYLGSQNTRRIKRAYAAHMRAQSVYRPRIYSGTITLFSPREEYAPGDSRPLWRNMTSGGFEVHLVPGDHRTMSEDPHLRTLVRELEGVIYEARQRTRAAAHGEAPQL